MLDAQNWSSSHSAFRGTDVFQTETLLVFVDPDYPDRMDAARKATESLDPDDMTDEARRMSVRLFGTLASWVQESVKLARRPKH